MNILVINSGSSSLKYQLIRYEDQKVLAKGLCERIGIEGARIKHKDGNGYAYEAEVKMATHADAVNLMLERLLDPEHPVIHSLEEIAAVGHRVVHGGPYFSKPVVMDEAAKEGIRKCFAWSPLHNPAHLLGIEVCEKAMPGIPQVSVFDTAFHQTMPPKAYMYGIPYEYYEKHKIRRYGFHGTSHAFVARRYAEMVGKDLKDLRLITCHMGNGSSFTAIKDGKCIDTSMGLTPLDGIIMGTRSGSLDPAIVTFMAQQGGYSPEEIDNILNKQSGFLGVSGVSSDFRDIYNAAEAGNERAELVRQMLAYQAAKIIGGYIVALGGLDAIVFTAGIGENASFVRRKICEYFEFMGLKLDVDYNSTIHGEEARVSTEDSSVDVCVIPTNEELSIAMQTVELLGLA
ncbi:MAG: acetate/propionate family kinase [Saccharofermentanales bacterium]|jgi:acetate kinase